MGGGCLVAILYKANETDFSHLGLGVLNESISILITEERNGIFELEMKYPTTANRFKDLKLDRLIKADANHKLKDQRFKIIRISKPMAGVVTVFAEHISYLSQDLALKPSVSYDGNANAALNTWKNNIVVAHPFTTYSDIATTGSGKWSIKDLENARQALGGISGSILDSYGGEYEFDNYDIRLYANRGRQSDMLIAYGRNLTELTQEETIDSTFTSIYPYTVTTENETDTILTLPEYFVDSQYVGNFARRKIMKVDFSQDGVTTVEQLRAKANAYILANGIGIPKVNLKVKFIDLAKSLDYKDTQSIEEVNLCDWVTVYFENFDIQTNAKIIKVVWDEILDQYDSIEIGEARANLTNAVNTAIDGKLETITQNLITVERAANGKNKVYRGVEEPLYGVLNDLWYKPVGSGEVEMYIHNGIVWHLEKYSGDAINGTVNFANVNAINLNLNRLTTATVTGANMLLDLQAGSQTFVDPNTGEELFFTQGRIGFSQNNQKRYIGYTDEGIQVYPDAMNTGTAKNTSIILNGGGTGSSQYLKFLNGGPNWIEQRITALDNNMYIGHGEYGSLRVRTNGGLEDTGKVIAGSFNTSHLSGEVISMQGNTIFTPNYGNRDMYLIPNGTGSVIIGTFEGTRWNVKASDFIKQSTRDSKTEIFPIQSKGMDVINRLSPVSYKKKDKLARGIDEVELGFIAEDSPEVATSDLEGIYDSHILTYAVKALQEKDIEIKYLKQELQDIKQKLGLS